MKIVFRVDSGFHIGIGHVMRCLTLADLLSELGHEISFITKNHLGFTEASISEKFPLSIIDGGLKQALNQKEKIDYSAWLGEDWSLDLQKTNDILKSTGKVDLVVVDHYSLDYRYEKGLNCRKVMAIDDLCNRNHNCDIILDQNSTADIVEYEKKSQNPHAKLVMGSAFALLRPEFESKHKQVAIGNNERELKNIVIFFGASDVNGDCLKIANSIEAEFLSKYNFTFILNSEHKDFEPLKTVIKPYPNVILLSFTNNMAELMMNTDLFIGAGGTTSWERSCLGVATALVSVADNQVNICEDLAQKNICKYLGNSTFMTKDSWAHFFREIVPNNSLWYSYRKNAYNLIDGCGAKRVAKIVEELLR